MHIGMAFISIELSREFGVVGVGRILMAHEMELGIKYNALNQDLHNNLVGLRASQNPNYANMPTHEIVIQLLLNGELMTVALPSSDSDFDGWNIFDTYEGKIEIQNNQNGFAPADASNVDITNWP